MWLPTDDGFMATQAQEALVLARQTLTNAPSPQPLVLRVRNSDDDAAAAALVVGALLFWLLLCGICRFYVFCPCPCCFCYIPCCCGFCLPKEPEKPAQRHHHDVHFYPGDSKKRQLLPAYASPSHSVDMEEPLLGAHTYAAPPPAYHDVPTAPPLSPP